MNPALVGAVLGSTLSLPLEITNPVRCAPDLNGPCTVDKAAISIVGKSDISHASPRSVMGLACVVAVRDVSGHACGDEAGIKNCGSYSFSIQTWFKSKTELGVESLARAINGASAVGSER